MKLDLNGPGPNAILSSVENFHGTENSDFKTVYDIEPACNENILVFWCSDRHVSLCHALLLT